MEQGPRRALNARVVLMAALLVLAWGGIAFRLMVVQGSRSQEFAARGLDQRLQREVLAADRGTIFDRDGRELAVTVDAVTVYANPAEIVDAGFTATRLGPLVGRDPAALAADLSADSSFVYVARQLDAAVAGEIRAADLPGIYTLEEPSRLYPTGEMAAQVVGFVQSDDNSGLEGLELHYEAALAGTPGELLVERDPYGNAIPQGAYDVVPAEPGSDLVTTVKLEIQYAAMDALARAIDRTGARSGSVIVLEPETGAILAMATLPTFDPNDRATFTEEALRNRAVTDVFEPGSTQKLVTIAAALDTGLVAPSTTFEIPSTIEIQDTVFEDTGTHQPVLDVTDIVTVSSNLGTILVGDRLGARRLYTYLSSFGEGRLSGVDFPGEAEGFLRPPEEWCLTTCLAGTSIGYHVSVTPLQMAMVYATIANDGVWVQPHLVAEVVDGGGARVAFEPEERRVVTQRTARLMRRMLEAVVERGTGGAAAVGGYRVGGKTGTTEKYLTETQTYSEEDVVASFIGMAPIDDPKVVIAVVLDSPQEDATGGTGAAPAFAEVARAALHQLGVPPEGGS